MLLKPPYDRIVFRLRPAQDRLAIEQASNAVAMTKEILRRCPVPDTFMGRKTQEPFPMEADRN